MNETEKLLLPRYKVIADYPNTEFEIGEVIHSDQYGEFNVYTDTGKWRLAPDAYPAIFRRLEWWEERSPDEMPGYVKADDGQVYKIKDWDNFSAPYVFVDDDIHVGFIKGCEYTPLYGGFLPATLEQYQTQNKKT
jgi:hypothetical protein